MAKSLRIFMHSIWQIFGNFGAALRLSALPYGLQIITLMLIMPMSMGMYSDEEVFPSTGRGAAFVLVIAVVVVTSLIIAVNWHRFILNNEAPRLIPKLHGSEMWRYLLRLALITIIIVAIMVPLVALLASLLAPIGSGLMPVATMTAALAASLVIFRLSVSLPAIAIGEQMSLREGWDSLSGQWPMLLGVGLLCVAGQFLLDLATVIFAFSPLLFIAAQVLVGWVTLMVGLSILTTLYGHYVQGRPLRQ